MRTIAFLLCSLVGYVIGHYLLTGTAAAFTSSIISYHLYLGILIFLNEKKSGVSMKPMQAIPTHIAFLAIVVGLPFLRAQIPFFSIVSLFIPALAPFEVEWLFSKGAKEATPVVRKEAQQIPLEDLLNAATGQDHAEFLEYMKGNNRAFRKSGRGIREEYGFWLADRASRKAAAVQFQDVTGPERAADSVEA